MPQISITVRPNPDPFESLTVTDALSQVLDLISALELYENEIHGGRDIVWRLKEASTSSPPFHLVAEPYAVQEDVPITKKVLDLLDVFSTEFRSLLDGEYKNVMNQNTLRPVGNIMERNLNGISSTVIQIDNLPEIQVRPESAKIAKDAIDNLSETVHYSEFGLVQGEVSRIRTYYGKPAFEMTDRIHRNEFVCVLEDEQAKDIGKEHNWDEAWEGVSVDVKGMIYYKGSGGIERIQVKSFKITNWSDIPMSKLPQVPLYEGKSAIQHLREVRKEFDGNNE